MCLCLFVCLFVCFCLGVGGGGGGAGLLKIIDNIRYDHMVLLDFAFYVPGKMSGI